MIKNALIIFLFLAGLIICIGYTKINLNREYSKQVIEVNELRRLKTDNSAFQALDYTLLGRWLLKYILDSNGVQLKVDPAMQGMEYVFYKNGDLEIRSPYTSKIIESTNNKITLPKFAWAASNGYLTIQGEKISDKVTPKATSSQYEIRNDSLILLQGNGMRYVFKRMGKVKEKK